MNRTDQKSQAQHRYLQKILDNHQSLQENRLKKKECLWSLVFILYLITFILILVYSILFENTKQIKSPFDYDGKQCGYDLEVRDCPFQMELFISNKTSYLCVKQCPEVNSYTQDCQQNQITNEVQLIQVDNICIKEYQFLSNFNYFHYNQTYLYVIIITGVISLILSLLQFNYLLKTYLLMRMIKLLLMSLLMIGLAIWIQLRSQIIQSDQFQIMIYILKICYFLFIIYLFRLIYNLYVQSQTFYKLADGIYTFLSQIPNFLSIILLQFVFLISIILLTYITLSYISYLGHATQNPNHQLSIIEYNYYQYILIIICFYFLQLTFILFQDQPNQPQKFKYSRNIIQIILKFQLGSVALSALIQSLTQLPLFLLQCFQYFLNLLQLWFDERLRLSLNKIISCFKYCDDRLYIISAYTGLSIRESSKLQCMINDEYKLDKFYKTLSYNLIISVFDIALNGLLTFGIVVSILIGINIKLYAQYILFFWYILLTSFIISNATLTYIQFIYHSIIILIIIDGDCHAVQRENLPQIFLEYHQYCNLQRKIFDEDNLLIKINQKYVKLKQQKLSQNNQNSEILEIKIQELKTQYLIHDNYRDQLDEEFNKIAQVKKEQN